MKLSNIYQAKKVQLTLDIIDSINTVFTVCNKLKSVDFKSKRMNLEIKNLSGNIEWLERDVNLTQGSPYNRINPVQYSFKELISILDEVEEFSNTLLDK